jgi:Protein of unknown function (DUF1036)
VGLYFQNRTQETILVAFGYPNNGCWNEGTGVQYSKKGWYSVAPGAEIKVYTGWVGGDAWFYHAEAQASGATWEGEFHTDVPSEAFDLCWGLGIGGVARDLGFRRVRPGADVMDYTVALQFG